MDWKKQTVALALVLLAVMAPSAGAERERSEKLTLSASRELDHAGKVRVRGRSPWQRQVSIEERVDGRWRVRAVTRPNGRGEFAVRIEPRATGETVLRARSGERTSAAKKAPGRPKPSEPDPAPEPPAAPRVLTGFSNNAVVQNQVSASTAAGLLSDAGAKIDRVQIDWFVLEREPGEYRWGRYDAIYAEDLARGVRPLFNFAYAPAWASGEPCPEGAACHDPPTPDHIDDAARAAAAIAARYPQAAGIEIWNEPNTPFFWGGEPDPAAYVELLAACATAIEAAAPATKVVGPAAASGAGSLTSGKIGGAEFLGAVLQAGAGSYLDAVSLHAYPSPTDPTLDTALVELDRVDVVFQILGAPALRLWITESGVSTTGPTAVSESEQARRLTELHRRFSERANVDMVLFHALVEPDRDRAYADAGYGVVTTGMRRKPAYCALATAWGAPAACG